jgi:hypothetical protein
MLLHPFMLAWLAGAAVPLVLHLLSRSQYRAVPWGAMMFLTGADAGPQYAARIRQWVLLLLRMGIVGLLAVALARPVISSRYAAIPTAGLTTAGPAAVVIILDDSASMGYQQNGKSRLDQAREVTLQILTALKRGDQAALILAGSRDYQPPIPPSADLQSIAGRVADLQPDIGQSDFAADLNRAANLLEHAGPVDREIYLICDRQALSWRNAADTFSKQWLARRKSAALPRLTVIPVGGDEADNLAVEGIEFPDHAAIRDQPANVQVRIHNYGPEIARAVPVSVWSGSRTFAEITTSIAPRATAVVNVTVRFTEAGSRVVSAAVKSAGLTNDDRLDASVDVLEPPQVLVVTRGRESATTHPAQQFTEMLLQNSGHRVGEPATIADAAAEDFDNDRLNKCNVVILDDVADLSKDQMKTLRRYLSAGGSVLLFPGETVTANQYNNSLCGPGGILQATIHEPVSKPAYVTNFDRQHLLLRSLSIRPDLLTKVAIPRCFPVTLQNSSVHVLARMTQGNPLLLEGSFGDGHVMMLTSGDRPAAGILMPALIRYLGTRSAADRNLYPGQPIIAITTDAVEDRSATVQFVSAGPRDPAIITRAGDRTEIRYGKTAKPGIYRLRYRSGGKEKLLSYVVNSGHADADLSPLTEEQWRSLADRLNFDRLDLSQTTVAAALDIQRDGREIWIDLLGGVLLLMSVETVLSRRWS